MKDEQESEIEFRRDEGESPDYPQARGLIVYQYGGELEECVSKARGEFNLGPEWKVVRFQEASI